MTLVRIWGASEAEREIQLVIPLPGKLTVSSIEERLPKLKSELRERWPAVTDVRIRRAPLRMKNPLEPEMVRYLARHIEGISVFFAKEVGKELAHNVVAFVLGWWAAKSRSKPRKKSKRKPSNKRRYKSKKPGHL
jgi:hypothetical protein